MKIDREVFFNISLEKQHSAFLMLDDLLVSEHLDDKNKLECVRIILGPIINDYPIPEKEESNKEGLSKDRFFKILCREKRECIISEKDLLLYNYMEFFSSVCNISIQESKCHISVEQSIEKIKKIHLELWTKINVFRNYELEN